MFNFGTDMANLGYATLIQQYSYKQGCEVEGLGVAYFISELEYFFKFDEVRVANRRRFFRFGKVGNRIPYGIWRLRFTLNYIFTFYLYVRSLDLEKCDGGTVQRQAITPDCSYRYQDLAV